MYNVKPVTTAHATACGPTSLKMLMSYYGVDVPLKDVIAECGEKITGNSMADLARVGRNHGLDMVSYQMDAEALLKNDRPAIIWWRRVHFVVFCGLNDKGEPVICNPSSGRFPMNRDAFCTAFSGIALCNGRPQDIINTDDYFGEKPEEEDYFND